MPDSPAELASRVARLLRHEVGDFLQGVYATTAVLQTRLGPTQILEHRLVADLRQRAELVLGELDGVIRLLSPNAPNLGTVDLTSIARAAVSRLKRTHPDLPVAVNAPEPALTFCDPTSLSDALGLLLMGLAAGGKAITVQVVGPVCEVTRDGPPPSSEQLAWLERPFATTRQGLLGLALALFARAARDAGGTIEGSTTESSCTVKMTLQAPGGIDLGRRT